MTHELCENFTVSHVLCEIRYAVLRAERGELEIHPGHQRAFAGHLERRLTALHNHALECRIPLHVRIRQQMNLSSFSINNTRMYADDLLNETEQ